MEHVNHANLDKYRLTVEHVVHAQTIKYQNLMEVDVFKLHVVGIAILEKMDHAMNAKKDTLRQVLKLVALVQIIKSHH